MATDALYDVNEWLIISVVMVLMLLATEIGFSCGKRVRQLHEHVRSQISILQAAILGLLALLLGFTFSMSMIRYDARKQLVLDEANAINTAYLRSKLLDETLSRQVATLLGRYVDVRIAFYRTEPEDENFQNILTETDALHEALWDKAILAGKKEPESETVPLYIQSVNDVIELHAKRLAAIDNHVPSLIFLLLYFVAGLSMALVGYGFGLGGERNFLVTIMTAILIASVILLIVDLDRPRRGLVSIGQKSLIDLRGSIHNEP